MGRSSNRRPGKAGMVAVASPVAPSFTTERFVTREDAGRRLLLRLLACGRIDRICALSLDSVDVALPVARGLGLPLWLLDTEAAAGGESHGREGSVARARMRERDASAFSANALEQPAEAVVYEQVGTMLAAEHPEVLAGVALDLPDLDGRTIAVIHDGLHEVAEVEAALLALRALGARRIIYATPVHAVELEVPVFALVDVEVALSTCCAGANPADAYFDPAPPDPIRAREVLAAWNTSLP